MALSTVFEDIEAHQLEASLLCGSLVLRNLKIRSEALAPLSLPIDVTYGYIRSLEIKVRLMGPRSTFSNVRVALALECDCHAP